MESYKKADAMRLNKILKELGIVFMYVKFNIIDLEIKTSVIELQQNK
jgi:hypothetical protein